MLLNKDDIIKDQNVYMGLHCDKYTFSLCVCAV